MVDKLLTGADPEFFLVDGGGNAVPAFDTVGGTKDKPREVKGGWVQEDGLAVEINIPPASCKNEFVDSISQLLDTVREMVYPLRLAIQPSMDFDMKYLLDPRAQTLGCEDSFNAMRRGDKLPVPLWHTNTPTRYAGGHLHFGHPALENNDSLMWVAISMLDSNLACPFIRKVGKSSRFPVYGMMGNYRPKSYGFEYRTLDNSWLSTTVIMEEVYDRANAIVNDVISSKLSESAYTNHKWFDDIDSVIAIEGDAL